MKHLTTLLLLSLLTLAHTADAQPDQRASRRGKKTSVIYIVGDGMGLNQVTLGRRAAQHLKQRYHFDRFKAIGLSSTKSANLVVTDSAAAGTALSSGYKTNNQMIGQDPQGQARETILEVAHRSGYKTGMVTTTRITHATPAAFATHTDHRKNEAKIAAQLVAQAQKGFPQVLIGGGARYLNAAKQEQLKAAGYNVLLDPKGLRRARGPRLAALLSSSHLPYKIDQPEGFKLRDLTRKAVSVLERQGPFFLMVEGGRVDHACHSHDAAALIREQLDLDDAIGWALDYAERRGNVLIVVTADHACGGLAITENADLDKLLKATASVEVMTKRSAKLAREQLAGLAQHLNGATGNKPTPAEILARAVPLLLAEAGQSHTSIPFVNDERDELTALLEKHADDRMWPSLALGHALSEKYGVSWYDPSFQHSKLTNTHGHNGSDVGVWAFGPGAQQFAGLYENTEIVKKIARIAGLPAPGRLLAPSTQTAALPAGALGQ